MNVKRAFKSTNPILLVCIIFLLSAGIRVIASASSAIASENEAEKITSEAAIMPADKAAIENVLNDLKIRKEILEEKERKVEKRIAFLAEAEKKFNEQRSAVLAAEQKLRSTIALAESVFEEDLVKLTAVYENMKPKDAAALFEQMEPDFAAGFLGRMRANNAAGIMSKLSPEVAYAISAVLAGRNSEVPRK